MSKENTPGIFVFVGENRSKTAQEKGYSWQECQITGTPRLAAKPLFEALEKIEIDPREQIFFNLWDDDWNLNKFIPEILTELADGGETIVAMGQKVHKELVKIGIPHKEMVHPAARGKIRKSAIYQKHVQKILLG